jgi:hypothetical protein
LDPLLVRVIIYVFFIPFVHSSSLSLVVCKNCSLVKGNSDTIHCICNFHENNDTRYLFLIIGALYTFLAPFSNCLSSVLQPSTRMNA